MPARNDILDSLRRNLPILEQTSTTVPHWTTYPDPAAHFASVLQSVGGQTIHVPNVAAIDKHLAEITPYATATQRCSAIAGAGSPNVDHTQCVDPHTLSDVDFALLPGEFAIAENGSVWVATDSVALRTLYFLTQHLALVVPAQNVLSNMHEAYDSLSIGSTRFGTFISGPSKTADIEQSLVIGAHGSRSLTVFLVAESPTGSQAGS